MLQSFWTRIEERLYGLIPPLLLIYIFFQPFNHFRAVKNIAFYSMLAFFLIKAARRGLEINWKDSTIMALLALLAVILTGILFSPYAIDSLNAFGNEFLQQITVFLVIVSEFRSTEKIKALLIAVVLSFITVTVIIFIKNPFLGLLSIQQLQELKWNRESFLGGYALNASFYIPFTIGYLFSSRDRLAVKGFCWIVVLFEFALVWLYYNSRTTLLSILASGIVIVILSGRYRILAVFLVIFLGVAGVSYVKKPDLFDRYKTLLSSETYITNAGLSFRGDIWKGTIDVIKDKPLIGRGYGWKKLATVVREEGYLEKWKEKRPKTYDYFNRTHYGSANPHNLVLELLFEVGALGLAVFVLFWATVCLKIMKTLKKRKDAPGNGLDDFVKYGMPGILTAYFLINLTNGLWGVITFVPAAITVAICELRKNTENTRN